MFTALLYLSGDVYKRFSSASPYLDVRSCEDNQNCFPIIFTKTEFRYTMIHPVTRIRRRGVVWSEIPRCWVGPVWFAWAGRRRRFNALKVIDSSSQAGCRQLQDRRTGGWPIPVRFLSRYRSQAVRVLDVPAQRTTPRWCDCNRVRAGRRHGASRGAVPVRCGALAKLEAGDIVRYYCACSNASLGSQ